MRPHPYIYSKLKAKQYRKRKHRDLNIILNQEIARVYINQCIGVFVNTKHFVVVKTKMLCECEKGKKSRNGVIKRLTFGPPQLIEASFLTEQHNN